MSDGTRGSLLEILQRQFPDSSKTTLREMLQSDRVRVNGAPERNAKREIGPDDRVEVGSRTAPIDPRIRILFEDPDLIVVDKAAGLLSVPTAEVLHETAESFLDAYLGGRPGDRRIHHVHRLDRDTSGVLVFAKNTWTRDRLRKQFEAHDIERVYVAIVHGKLREPAGTFRSTLAEDAELRVRSVADASAGKEAVTHYRTIASGRRFSILEVTLETGRRNQIRVHLAEAGHPVAGDTMYGRGRDESLGRLGLHAKRLGFTHPRSGEKLVFASDVPKAFRDLAL
ncbi:MAG TPA: RluA family pseudouridine synthase [Thermoanaerobaculia bacterium]|nr:RluA family pseudouridine synthase [Thermoanaerobaculia bacterium]